MSLEDTKNIRRVVKLYSEAKTNEYLKKGWVLLSAGFESDGTKSAECYILGSYEPETLSSDSKPAAKFRNE